MIVINEDWAIKVDKLNNWMPHRRMKTIVDKGKPTEHEELVWRHTGTYHGNPQEVLRYVVKVTLREEAEKVSGDSVMVPLEEFITTLNKSKEYLDNFVDSFKEKL